MDAGRLRNGIAASVALLMLSGCASFSSDGGFGAVEQAVSSRAGQTTQWVRSPDAADAVATRLAELLAKPIDADAAVRIALLNNAGLQAEYATLGIAEAELVQASRWRGPRLSFARLVRGDELEIERGIFFDVLGLLAIPLSTKAQGERFEATKLRAAGAALRVAQEARKAWINAVASQQGVTYAMQVKDAAEAGAELGKRMAAAGNWSSLAEANEKAFELDALAQLARARQVALAARERLIRALGLASGNDLRLPERLPDVPPTLPKPFPDVEATNAAEMEVRALAQRLDVQAARRDAEALAQSLGLARVTRYVDLVELGFVRKTSAPGLPQRGWELDIRLPIFDFGEAKTVRAESQYLQAFNRARDTAVRARSEVRETHGALRERFELARHYRDDVLPLRKRVSEEVLLRYNGMLSSVFDLLADARSQTASVMATLEAQRDYWLAESDFQMALTGLSPGGNEAAASGTAAASAAPAGGGH
jgi:outer membrane protein TolC